MKKVTRKKEVKETKDIIIYIAEDGKEFDKFCDCARYERELLGLRNFSEIKTKTIINEFGQEELWYFIRDKKDLDTLMNHLENGVLVMLYFSDDYLILFDEKITEKDMKITCMQMNPSDLPPLSLIQSVP